MRRLLVSLAALLWCVVLVPGCWRSRPEAAVFENRVPDSVGQAPLPVELQELERTGDDLFALAAAGDWQKSSVALLSMKESLARFEAVQQREFRPVEQALHDLDGAIDRQKKREAMEQANEMTRIVIEMSRDFTAPHPIEIPLLQYWGRELRVQSPDPAGTEDVIRELRRTWSAVKPQVARLGGNSEALSLDALLSGLTPGMSEDQAEKTSTRIIDAIHQIEKVFQRSGQGHGSV